MNNTKDHASPMAEIIGPVAAAAIDRYAGSEPPKTEPVFTAEQIAASREANLADRESAFLSVCPPLYQDTDPAMIPDQTSLARVMAWRSVLDYPKRVNPRGLMLVGEPGSGKTRAAWLKIRVAMVKGGCRVKAFDGIGWGLAVSKHLGDPETAEEWVDECCAAHILFIDDCFKARMTEAQEFAIFGVLDRRASKKRPTIVTMNSSGAALASRTAKAAGEGDRFDAIVRRLTEFSDVIQFKRPAATAK